jgi:hypothetical protein
VAVGKSKRGPTAFVDELFVALAVLPERRRCHHGARVDDTPHRLGPLALVQDSTGRVHHRLRGVSVLQNQIDVWTLLERKLQIAIVRQLRKLNKSMSILNYVIPREKKTINGCFGIEVHWR